MGCWLLLEARERRDAADDDDDDDAQLSRHINEKR